MTLLALVAGVKSDEMFTHLPLGANEGAGRSGVAAHTGGRQDRVIDFGSGPHGGAGVAGFACQGGGNVLGGFAFEREGAGTVVAGRAGGGRLNLQVIELQDRLPFGRGFAMAGLAHVAGVDAGLVFARHDADVGEAGGAVAAGAVAGKTGVVNRRGLPGGNGVAGVAALGGRDMSGRALTRR